MSRSCHFRSPSSTISMQPLYAARRPVHISDQAKRINNQTWKTRILFIPAYLFKTRKAYIHRPSIPTRDERHSRENSNGCRCTSRRCRKTAATTPLLDCSAFGSYSLPHLISRCTSIKVRFGSVGLPTEWLILGDSTEAADYTKLWNDQRESISFVKGAMHKHF